MFKILLDLDGVIVNFVDGICKALGYPNPYLAGARGWNVWEKLGISEEEGISEKEFWKPCESAKFWTGLNWMPDGNRLLDLVVTAVGKENVFLLTTPAPFPGAYAGKFEWVSRELPIFRGRLMMSPADEIKGEVLSHKDLYAKPGQILIDDADHNVEAFRSADGEAILVPRPWNKGHGRNPVVEVREELRRIMS